MTLIDNIDFTVFLYDYKKAMFSIILIFLKFLIKLLFLQVNRKSKFQVFPLDFWIKKSWFQLFSPWPKMISAYFNRQKSVKFLKLSWFLRNLSNYRLITIQILFHLKNILSLFTACVSSSRKDKKIYEYFIVTVQTFFISFSCFTYRNNDLNSPFG